MPDLQATAEYLSTGANRHTAVADWSQSGVLAFGANSNICLWTPSASSHVGIAGILSGHKDAVKAVKFLPPTEGGNEVIISGSDDKTLKLWELNADHATGQCVQTLTDHTAPINTIAILKSRNPSTPTLIATGAADATFRVWKYEARRLLLLSTIKPTPKFFPLTLALSTLDHGDDVVVLAVAGTRDIIQIHVAANTAASLNFQLQATLTGHEGWIRSLDFTWESSAADSDLLLASASQDKYVRLWRLHQGSELPAMTSNADPATSAFLPGKSPANKAHRLQSCDKVFSITFEALLLGHEDWIYSAKWFPDNSLAIWEADPASGIWVSMLLQANPKGHSRMILDAAWAPSASPAAFATAGRDKKVRVWSAKTADDGKTAFVQAAEVACGEPVTAVDFLGRSLANGALVLAVGTESGKMAVHTLDATSLQVVSSTPLPEHLCLPTTVLQLAWRPADDDSQEYQLAVAGEDSSTRIYRLPGLVSA
ncbi:hypothetical protein VdG1_03728 [Verticillium dahliae VDG1]|nr:hypothetical protein VdG1_03728 [Verticillium dahliae VDG1]